MTRTQQRALYVGVAIALAALVLMPEGAFAVAGACSDDCEVVEVDACTSSFSYSSAGRCVQLVFTGDKCNSTGGGEPPPPPPVDIRTLETCAQTLMQSCTDAFNQMVLAAHSFFQNNLPDTGVSLPLPQEGDIAAVTRTCTAEGGVTGTAIWEPATRAFALRFERLGEQFATLRHYYFESLQGGNVKFLDIFGCFNEFVQSSVEANCDFCPSLPAAVI